MHTSPIFTTWRINCRSAEGAQSLRKWLVDRVDLNRVMTDVVLSAPNGTTHSRTDRHRLGDYFAMIETLPARTPGSFRLVFQRRPEAARFWKDLMVNILQEIESAPQRAIIEADTKDDVHPDQIPAR